MGDKSMEDKSIEREIIQEFNRIFDSIGDHESFFAPGRVNLIGEHTDYNGGHVFPCALTIGTYCVVQPRKDKLLRFYSMNFTETGVIEVSLENLEYRREDSWTNYPKGVIWAVQREGYEITHGMDLLYYGTIPHGSGLSSSASIEVLTGFILRDIFRLPIDPIKLALLCQKAENLFIGVNCGIMDQFAIAMGKKGYAIFLDTADLSYVYAPLQLGDSKIVIMNTNKKRGLEASEYNKRRSECERALAQLQKVLQINTLGDLSEEQFREYQEYIEDPTNRRRARHAVSENQRTLRAAEALQKHDLALFGRLMVESHESLRNDYEVTGLELDTIVEAALKQGGVYGARMTGAGFGGCAVGIVQEAYLEEFVRAVGQEYLERIGYEASFYLVDAGEGPMVRRLGGRREGLTL